MVNHYYPRQLIHSRVEPCVQLKLRVHSEHIPATCICDRLYALTRTLYIVSSSFCAVMYDLQPWHSCSPGTHAALALMQPWHSCSPGIHAALALMQPWHSCCPGTHAALALWPLLSLCMAVLWCLQAVHEAAACMSIGTAASQCVGEALGRAAVWETSAHGRCMHSVDSTVRLDCLWCDVAGVKRA